MWHSVCFQSRLNFVSATTRFLSCLSTPVQNLVSVSILLSLNPSLQLSQYSEEISVFEAG